MRIDSQHTVICSSVTSSEPFVGRTPYHSLPRSHKSHDPRWMLIRHWKSANNQVIDRKEGEWKSERSQVLKAKPQHGHVSLLFWKIDVAKYMLAAAIQGLLGGGC